jgi:hypothetical protein
MLTTSYRVLNRVGQNILETVTHVYCVHRNIKRVFQNSKYSVYHHIHKQVFINHMILLVIINQPNNGAFSFHLLLLAFYPTRRL